MGWQVGSRPFGGEIGAGGRGESTRASIRASEALFGEDAPGDEFSSFGNLDLHTNYFNFIVSS